MNDKAVVTCAISGVLATKEHCPAIPYTPEEYARDAKRCVDAGCSVIHIHARKPTGAASWDVEDFRNIRDAILAETDVIINFSTGGRGPPSGRIAHIDELVPEMGAVNMGSMNYAKYSAKRKTFVLDLVFQNPFKDIVFYLEHMRDAGVKPELECFDVGHTNSIEPLLDLGVLKPPLQFSFIMGVLGGLKATPENLAAQARQVEVEHTWEVIGIGRTQWAMIEAALELGGNIRAGLEDNFYLPSGEMAESNAHLIDAAAALAHDRGRTPASVEEARQILSLGSPHVG